MRRIIFISTLVLILAVIAIPALAAGPWKGKIIDIETKEPIEGAVVVAVWKRAYRTLAGENTYFYEAKEVLTDKEGRFEIPAYTPINLLPIISYIREPEFTIFKPGYLSLTGRYLEENVIDKPTDFKRNGKIYRLANGIIELPKLNTKQERIKSLNAAEGFPIGYAPDHKLKHLLEMIYHENKNLGLKK